MQKLVSLSLFLFSMCSIAQNRIDAYIIDNKNVTQKIYLPYKKEILTYSDTIYFYREMNSREKFAATASDIKEIGYADKSVVIKSERVKSIDLNKNIFLRQLTQGALELYIHTSSSAKSCFILKDEEKITVLKKSNDLENNTKSFKEVLFKDFNPRQLSSASYVNVSYNTESLISYLKENYTQNNIVELPQEYKVNSFNYNLQAGFSRGTVGTTTEGNGESTDADIPVSGFHVGIRVEKNLDQITNKLTAFTGLHYYSLSGSDNYTFNERSNVNRIITTANINVNYISISLGLKYNLHANQNFIISPYIGFEFNKTILENSLNYISNEDEEVTLKSEEFLKNLDALQLGIDFIVMKHFTLRAGYTTLLSRKEAVTFEESMIVRPTSSKISLNKIDLTIGYRF